MRFLQAEKMKILFRGANFLKVCSIREMQSNSTLAIKENASLQTFAFTPCRQYHVNYNIFPRKNTKEFKSNYRCAISLSTRHFSLLEQTQQSPNNTDGKKKGESRNCQSVNDCKSTAITPRDVSSLYVPRHRRTEMFSVLVPYLDYDAILGDPVTCKKQLNLRAVDCSEHSIAKLRDQWYTFKRVRHAVEEVDTKLAKITKHIKASAKKAVGSTSEIFDGIDISTACVKDLELLKRKLKKDMKNNVYLLNSYEDDLIPQLLSIPNCVSPTTPTKQQVELYFPVPRFNFSPLSHVQLSQMSKKFELSGTSRGTFYLHGELAQVELALQEYVSNIFDNYHYLQQANPDFAKGVSVEGCAMNSGDMFLQPQTIDSLRLVRNAAEEDISPLFLVGGASLPSYVGYYAKKIVTNVSKFLPQKLYSVGRIYSKLNPNTYESNNNVGEKLFISLNEERVGLLDSMQSTAVSCFVLVRKENCVTESDVINEIKNIVSSIYGGLGLHYRIVHVPADQLKQHEKEAYSFQMITITSRNRGDTSKVGVYQEGFVDASESVDNKQTVFTAQNYIEVGRLSLCGDYISKRLLMTYAKDKAITDPLEESTVANSEAVQHDFLECVYCEVMNVTKLLAVMMENTQTADGNYVIPDVLRQFYVTKNE